MDKTGYYCLNHEWYFKRLSDGLIHIKRQPPDQATLANLIISKDEWNNILAHLNGVPDTPKLKKRK